MRIALLAPYVADVESLHQFATISIVSRPTTARNTIYVSGGYPAQWIGLGSECDSLIYWPYKTTKNLENVCIDLVRLAEMMEGDFCCLGYQGWIAPIAPASEWSPIIPDHKEMIACDCLGGPVIVDMKLAARMVSDIRRGGLEPSRDCLSGYLSMMASIFFRSEVYAVPNTFGLDCNDYSDSVVTHARQRGWTRRWNLSSLSELPS
jgi:hypothetical protein